LLAVRRILHFADQLFTKSSAVNFCFSWVSGIAAAFYCASTNPTEISFRDTVISMSNEMALIPKSILNTAAANHITFLESCYNQGIVRRLSIGVASFIWLDNYDPAVGNYASQCSYLQPRYLRFHQRVIDIGFIGRWWMMDSAMIDFDVNPFEWKDQQS